MKNPNRALDSHLSVPAPSPVASMAHITHSKNQDLLPPSYEHDTKNRTSDFCYSGGQEVCDEKFTELNKYMGVKLCAGTMIHEGVSIRVHLIRSNKSDVQLPMSLPTGIYWDCPHPYSHSGPTSGADTSPCFSIIRRSLSDPDKNRMEYTEVMQYLELCTGILVLDHKLVTRVAVVILDPSQRRLPEQRYHPGITWFHSGRCPSIRQNFDTMTCDSCCSTALASNSMLAPPENLISKVDMVTRNDLPILCEGIMITSYHAFPIALMLLHPSIAPLPDVKGPDGVRWSRCPFDKSNPSPKHRPDGGLCIDCISREYSKISSLGYHLNYSMDKYDVVRKGSVVIKGEAMPVAMVAFDRFRHRLPTLQPALHSIKGTYWWCTEEAYHQEPQSSAATRPCTHCMSKIFSNTPWRGVPV